MDQNSDTEIELYEEIIGDVGYNSAWTQAPSQKLAVTCPSDRTPFQGPISNEDRELFAYGLRPALRSYNELAEASQVPQKPVVATPTYGSCYEKEVHLTTCVRERLAVRYCIDTASLLGKKRRQV